MLICEILRKTENTYQKNCFYKTEKRTAHCKTKRAFCCKKWQDKRKVLMLSTHHSGKMIENNRQTKGWEKKKHKNRVYYVV